MVSDEVEEKTKACNKRKIKLKKKKKTKRLELYQTANVVQTKTKKKREKENVLKTIEIKNQLSHKNTHIRIKS